MTDELLMSCDWGTSAFRLRLLHGNPQEPVPLVVAEHVDHNRGITSFSPCDVSGFARFLAEQIPCLFRAAGVEPRRVAVWLSGMITSSLGWKELPYAPLPFTLDGSAAVIGTDNLVTAHGPHELFFVSGLRAADDVMRGEECELIGIFAHPEAARYSESALVVLPGTHSKCIDVKRGSVTAFRTFLTGELFELLCRHSILRHSVGPEDAAVDCREAFRDGVLEAAKRGLLASLFSVRARALLDGVDPQQNRAYLSGLLIGDELTSVSKRFVQSTPILLCGNSGLTGLYADAFEVLGLTARVHIPAAGATGLAACLGHWRLHFRGAH